MTRRRGPDFDLAAAARAPSFTPRDADVPALLALVPEADDRSARAIVRALLRVVPPERLARELAAILDDEDPRRRRRAASALGRLGAASEAPLLRALDRERDPANRRAIAAALGKIGGRAALARLETLAPRGDPELARLVDRARLTIARTIGRDEGGRLDDTVAPPAPLEVVLRCRAGIEPILAEEVPPAWSPRVLVPGAVAATLRTPMRELFRCRTMLRFGFPLSPPGPGDPAEALARVITGDVARRIFRAFTVGPVRWRLAFASGGHRRALVWRCARLVAERAPELTNDPTSTLWEVIAGEPDDPVELVPRRLDDPRFVYRQGDVPAASHPTLAAAIARVAGAHAHDVVWDPFVGSGTELVERARLGPARALLGTDLDPRALSVAAANLAAAGVQATLSTADARTHAPPGVTQILTNPPMGRRVLDRRAIGPLYDRFLAHAAEVLVPGGRLVWISPLPSRTLAAATAAGLALDRAHDVDMGGFTAQLQAFVKRPLKGA